MEVSKSHYETEKENQEILEIEKANECEWTKQKQRKKN